MNEGGMTGVVQKGPYGTADAPWLKAQIDHALRREDMGRPRGVVELTPG